MIELKHIAVARRRIMDSWGGGEYGDSRGPSRTHNGIDFYLPVGTEVLPIKEGAVTKLGFCYSDDLSFRYVQVTTQEGINWRYFYLEPAVSVGDYVFNTTVLGTVQSLAKRYFDDEKGPIQSHCHDEIKQAGNYLNHDNME